MTGILLAGGKSRRMGEDKRYVSVGELTLLERSLSALRSVFRQVVVVIAQDSSPLTLDVPVIRDLVPDCGSLGGLYTGLKESRAPSVFVAACDMPFLQARSIRLFLDYKHDSDVVMARLQNGLHPMHALYSQRCLPIIEEMIRARLLKIQELIARPSLKVHIITQDELSDRGFGGQAFLNVNTPADLEAARSLAERPPGTPLS